MTELKKLNAWPAILALTVAAFVFNTSEFVPIGLLSDLALSFDMTEAEVGLILTVYAWVVLVMSLPLILIFSKVNFKYLLLGVLALFVISHLASFLATSFNFLMAARIGVALAHSLFWSIATPLAVKIVSDENRSKALSLVAAGTAVAMVAGMPLGRVIGLYVGWQITFLLIGIIALLVFIALIFVCPKVPGSQAVTLKILPQLAHNKTLMAVYVVTALVFTAHYTGYSYIEPYLAQVANFSPNFITLTLILFGAMGIICSFIFSSKFDNHENFFILGSILGLAIFLLSLHLASWAFKGTSFINCLLWGLSFSTFSLTFQALILKLESEYAAIAMSIYSAICNLGIGAGAFIGSHLSSIAPIYALGYVGSLLALGAFLLSYKKLRQIFN